ncbi:MAG TPA: hypothetical protein VFR24_22170 [Candidatus Angelobacter sp.]|nr:hypothetical protein [Candidatus Angelobacter sp.]
MTTSNLDLHFAVLKGPTGKPQPTAQIYLKSGAGSAFPGIDKCFIGSGCINLGEVEHQLEQLEREIKELRAKAKKRFAEAKAVA